MSDRPDPIAPPPGPAAAAAPDPTARALAAADAARRAAATAEAAAAEALGSDRSRRRGALHRALWDARRALMPDALSHGFAEAGQDRLLDFRVFAGLERGVFVDVGAHDGVRNSNTLYFEAFRRWTGLLIEPAPDLAAAARRLRRAPVIETAVGGQAGEADFLTVERGFTQMSGLLATYDPGKLARVRADPRHAERVVRVPVRPLGDILAEHGLDRVDYVSLDVEGGEAAILSTFPFDRIDVTAWSVENEAGGAVAAILEPAGYRLVDFAGVDELWAKPERMAAG